MNIGSYEVKVIDKDKLQVGCQEVTRQQLTDLLAELNKPTGFIRPRMFSTAPSTHEWLNFSLHSKNGNFATNLYPSDFSKVHYVDFCLYRKAAIELRDFLIAELAKTAILGC